MDQITDVSADHGSCRRHAPVGRIRVCSRSVSGRAWLTFAAACSSVSMSSLVIAQTQSDQQTPPSEQTLGGRLDSDKIEPDSGAEVQPGKLEEITVTAQRRSEQLQRVPISITAITADTLAKAGVTDTQSLAIATPGLQLNSVRAAVVPFLRGIGTVNITAGDEGATAIYVDGVLSPRKKSYVVAGGIALVSLLAGYRLSLLGNGVGLRDAGAAGRPPVSASKVQFPHLDKQMTSQISRP